MLLHIKFRLKNLLLYENKVLVLIRNPLKVMLSYFRHSAYGIHSDTDGEAMEKYWHIPQNSTFKEEYLNSGHFEWFVLKTIVVWARTITGEL